MKKVAVLQSNYLPWKGYFDLIHDADIFIYYDEVKYTKNDWRNRNRIYTKNGLQWLTIPISRNAVKLKISDVNISDQNWQKEHFLSLYYGYKRAPFFSQLEPMLELLYLEKKYDRLVEVNRCAIEWVSGKLGITTKLLDSRDFNLVDGRIPRLRDLLSQSGATDYVSGPSARNYLGQDESFFNESGINIHYKDYSGYPEYRQLRLPFEHSVSIVDMVAHISWNEIGHHIWGWREAEVKRNKETI